jgi:hypothetical protein
MTRSLARRFVHKRKLNLGSFCSRAHPGTYLFLVDLGFGSRVWAARVPTMVALTTGRDDIAFAASSAVLSRLQMLGCASSLLDFAFRYRFVANEWVGAALPHQPITVETATVLSLVGFYAELFEDEVFAMSAHGQGLLVKQVPVAHSRQSGRRWIALSTMPGVAP